ncbi:MAG: N-acetylglucosamine-6-phosphate deacetylase [Alphaproteobacteria bacterium]|nr:N-acetylglucosamine-6-phosphate deacetylase [Alphaproteobacteria bacterium]MDE2631040.1 N-acetylglucosamine-6-phosphate deacetylase [Alphaproteobacteria bacterium]
MTIALANGRIVTGRALATGLAVLIEDGRIKAVVPAPAVPQGSEVYDLEGGTLLPGFIDVQVNGGGGILFNDIPTVQALRTIGRAHSRFGTTGFLPTIISADLATLAKAIATVDDAIAAGVPGVLGIHIEGPFLNAERKGIHDPANFGVLDTNAFSLVTSLKHGKTVLTLAPETTNPRMITALTEAGVLVSAGHTNASYEILTAAFAAGLRGFTHLFNAMSQLEGRTPGAVGSALEHDESWCGIIADGHHVHPASLRVALRCKGRDRLMLVTDAMSSVGSSQKSFELSGKTISVQNGVCVGPDGTLAGSDLDMAAAFRNARSIFKLDLPDLSRLASGNAAEFLGLEHEIGFIRLGTRADLVLMNDELQVRQCWIGGNPQIGRE